MVSGLGKRVTREQGRSGGSQCYSGRPFTIKFAVWSVPHVVFFPLHHTIWGLILDQLSYSASPCDGNVTSHKCNIDLGLMWVRQ